MKLTEAEEWAIHNRATQVVFSLDDLSTVQRYNKKLNNHERVTEYAESLGAEMVVARYFGLDYDINVSKGKREADVGKGLEVKWTSYINGSLIVYPNERVNEVHIVGQMKDVKEKSKCARHKLIRCQMLGRAEQAGDAA